MDIKKTIEESKKNKLLKENPQVKTGVEVVVEEQIKPELSRIDENVSSVQESISKVDQNITKVSENIEELKEGIKEMVEPEKLATLFFKQFKGDQGYTPEKGKDYFTEEEVQEIVNRIEALIPPMIPAPIKGEPGQDAITPIKGKDYFTKEEIKQFKTSITPIKGIDYVDGKDAIVDYRLIISEAIKQIPPAKDGRTPKHEIEGLKIRFENPDGTMGNWIDFNFITRLLKHSQGGGGVGTIKDAGTVVKTGASEINFGNNLTVTVTEHGVTVDAAAGGAGGHTIQEEGADLTARTYLDFIGAGITASDDAGNDKTKVTLDATLNSIAALGTAADKIAYTTGIDTWAETGLTAFGRSIIDDADEATFKATVNLEIGVDVQAYSANTAFRTDKLSVFAATTSLELAGVISDEVGSGSLVFNTSPTFTTSILPTVNDGTAIGAPTTGEFSDLYLAEGGVINWDNGDATLTQAGNVVTLAGADLTVPNITVGSGTGIVTTHSVKSDHSDGVIIEANNGTDSAIFGVGNTANALFYGALTANDLITGSKAGVAGRFVNTSDSASVQVLKLEGDRATVADNDEAYLSLILSDSAGNQDEQGRITWKATTVLNGATQDGDLILSTLVDNTLTTFLTLDGSASAITAAFDVSVPDEVYGAGWNGSLEVPTKNAIYDKIETLGGGGNVSKVGTPVDNQIGVWTGDGTIEGDANLTWDGTSFNIATAKNFQIAGATILADAAGTTTLSNIDALDATTEATIEAAIDTLANLTSIQGQTVTLAGSLITSGAFSLTLTQTAATNVTLPTTGTLATLAGSETLSGKTLTAPKFADLGYIADANGNELIILDTVTSAVNEVTFANAATGNNPKFSATGSDANVGIDLQAKGTGTYRLLGTSDQAAELRLYEDTDVGTNYTAFKVGTQAGDVTYTLPTAAPASDGYVLSSTTAGVMSWAAGGSGSGPSLGLVNAVATGYGGTFFQ